MFFIFYKIIFIIPISSNFLLIILIIMLCDFSTSWFFMCINNYIFHYKSWNLNCKCNIVSLLDGSGYPFVSQLFGDYSCLAPVSLQGGNYSGTRAPPWRSNLLFSWAMASLHCQEKAFSILMSNKFLDLSYKNADNASI